MDIGPDQDGAVVADAKDAGVELPNLASLLGDDRSLDHVLGNAVSVGDAAATAAAPAVARPAPAPATPSRRTCCA